MKKVFKIVVFILAISFMSGCACRTCNANLDKKNSCNYCNGYCNGCDNIKVTIDDD